MRGDQFDRKMETLKVSDDLIGERDLMIKYLVERNEINYTLHFFSARILVVLIFLAVMTLLFYKGDLIMRLLPMISAAGFYFLSIRLKENFVMSNFGIQLAKTILNSKIAEKFNLIS
jgi:hypothetical protein